MENIDKLKIIDEKIYFWTVCRNSVLNEIQILNAGESLPNEDHGNKQIDVQERILSSHEYINICNNKIAFFEAEKMLLTNQG